MGSISKQPKLAVITGASSGIGFELAKQCASNGYDVLVCAEDVGIRDAAAQISAAGGGAADPIQADLATRDGCAELVRAVKATGRAVDALLLNAGVGVGGEFMTTDLEAEINMVELNCIHTLRIAKALVPDMVARGEGRVLMTASVVSTAPAPYQAIYAATKAFVMQFAEALRFEIKDSGVTVTALQPGATDTNFFERAGMLDTKVGQAEKDPPSLVARRGFEAMLAGKDSVLGGSFVQRLEGLANEVLPETIKAAQVAKVSKPGSAKH